MAARVEVVLSWAIGGAEVRRWRVPRSAFLDSVVTEELLDSLPGEVEVVQGQERLQRPLHVEDSKCSGGDDDGQILLGLVKTKHIKDRECTLVPYLGTDGDTAVRIPSLRWTLLSRKAATATLLEKWQRRCNHRTPGLNT